MKREVLLEYLNSGAALERLSPVYGDDAPDALRRLAELTGEFAGTFPCDHSSETRIFSAPGRAELGGSHIDHQLGHGLAASVNLDTIACVAPNHSRMIRIQSRNHRMAEVNLDDLSIHEDETGSSMALVRGLAAAFSRIAGRLHGFDVYTTTTVLRGGGLSSSAAFEVLIAAVFNHLFCNGELNSVQTAQAAQFAENVYFGKPGGLLDQLACSQGGVIGVDFGPRAGAGQEPPEIKKLSLDLARYQHALCIIDTRASHAPLKQDIAAVSQEMGSVAREFGADVLRKVDYRRFLEKLPEIRAACGDRAALRAYHYFHEDKRVQTQIQSLESGDFQTFLDCVRESGRSSFLYLQNATNYRDSRVQPLGVFQAAAEELLGGKGAVRVHGGGFAGTLMAFVPLESLGRFTSGMEAVAGSGSCRVLQFRDTGAAMLIS